MVRQMEEIDARARWILNQAAMRKERLPQRRARAAKKRPKHYDPREKRQVNLQMTTNLRDQGNTYAK